MVYKVALSIKICNDSTLKIIIILRIFFIEIIIIIIII